MYDQAKEISYDWPAQAFGAATKTYYIQGPKGLRGRVTYIEATPTVSFVGTTTPAAVQAGVTGTLTKFANMPMGAAGAGTPANTPVVASDGPGGLTGSATVPYAYADKDTPIVITLLAATGGAPAGTADVVVKVEWF